MSFRLPEDLDPAIRAVLPSYVAIRRQEQGELRAALETGDQKALEALGHRITGTGTSFGLPRMTELGRALQLAAREGDLAACARCVADMGRLLDQVESALQAEARDGEAPGET